MSHEELALTAYEAYRKTAGGPSFHHLTPEQRSAWVDAVEAVYATVYEDAYQENTTEDDE